ncbi:MAG TPA: Uma2 family endonuclease [Candidatus Acidoferrales bacterium]|jgi:Uma2 family endonuclease|nr:Uma2 family endonuclease [Candidatus Acidoferrales bacterium]
MSATTQTTWEEFLDLPDAPGKQELLDGELIILPPAKLVHMQVTMDLFLMLVAALSKSRVWHETGYQLRRGWLQPDVSVTWPDQPIENDWLQHAPMVAVEVVSPSNRPEHIDKKVSVYLEEGAAEVWVIYPATHSMTVFRKGSWERVTDAYNCALLGVVVDLAVLLPPMVD